MAFVRVLPQVINKAGVGTGIKAALRCGGPRSKVRSPAKLTISITGGTIAKLGFKADDEVEVEVGDKEHHGLLRMRRAAERTSETLKVEARAAGPGANKTAFLLIQIGHLSQFVDRTEQSAWCRWEEIEHGWIEIVLPRWADETKPKGAIATTQLKQPDGIKVVDGRPPKHLLQSAPVSVTAHLMGDPPADRREMLKKMGDMKV